MHLDLKDDLRQSIVVAKNEIKKFMAGKRILLFGILVLALELLNLIIPFILGSGFDSATDAAESLLGNITLFIVIAAILFTATSIVSEFEERTALMLFTKPIRKWSIFMGKLLASLIIMIGFLVILYLFSAIVCLATCGSIASGMATSFGLAICGALGTSGLAIMLSSIFKKGSTSSIMTLVFYLLILGIVGALIVQYAHIEIWWMLDQAMSNIIYAMGVPNVVSTDPIIIVYTTVPSSELVRSGGVMVAWGIVTAVVGFFLFNKRDF